MRCIILFQPLLNLSALLLGFILCLPAVSIAETKFYPDVHAKTAALLLSQSKTTEHFLKWIEKDSTKEESLRIQKLLEAHQINQNDEVPKFRNEGNLLFTTDKAIVFSFQADGGLKINDRIYRPMNFQKGQSDLFLKKIMDDFNSTAFNPILGPSAHAMLKSLLPMLALGALASRKSMISPSILAGLAMVAVAQMSMAQGGGPSQIKKENLGDILCEGRNAVVFPTRSNAEVTPGQSQVKITLSENELNAMTTGLNCPNDQRSGKCNKTCLNEIKRVMSNDDLKALREFGTKPKSANGIH